MPSGQKRVNADAAAVVTEQIAPELRLAGIIMELVRELKRSTPAPRAAPYFGLDHDAAYDLSVLDSLSSRGIFRKYELVLLVGSGLGGHARWLSRRLGCRILGLDAAIDLSRAASRLNQGAGMTEDVWFAAGRWDALPFRSRVFTHVWMIDPAPEVRARVVLEEAFRVLRSGAHFAMQFAADAGEAALQAQDVLSSIGFVEFTRLHVQQLPPGQSYAVAKRRLYARIDGDSAVLGVCRSGIARPTPAVQLFCRRP